MSVTSQKLAPTTSTGTVKSTSLQASGGGPSLSVSQAGRTIDRSGQVPVLVNRSALRGREGEQQTTGIFGRQCSLLLSDTDLSQSLASKLFPLVHWHGSIWLQPTWKERVTPSGRSLPLLHASARTTSDSALTGWPTPTASAVHGMSLRSAIKQIARPGAQLSLREIVVACCNPNGASAETGNVAHLNPELVRWLMDFPAAWSNCAPTETPSTCRKP